MFVTFSLNGYSQVLVANSNGDSNGDSKLFNEMLTAQIPISDLNSNSFSKSTILPFELVNSINSTLIFLPYNTCGGGCVSDNARCCGTCISGNYGTGTGCPGNYMCIKVMSLDENYRYECWHYGITNGGKGFGMDVDNDSLSNCSFFNIFKQIDSNSRVLLGDNISYDNESTVAGWDSVVDTGYSTLKYIFEFYNSTGELIMSRIFND